MAVRKVTLLPERKEFRLAIDPESVRPVVPEPPAVTPPPLVAESDPVPTENVAVTEAEAASGSAKEIPVNASATSSVTEMLPGAEMLGASFTAANTEPVLRTPHQNIQPLKNHPKRENFVFIACNYTGC